MTSENERRLRGFCSIHRGFIERFDILEIKILDKYGQDRKLAELLIIKTFINNGYDFTELGFTPREFLDYIA